MAMVKQTGVICIHEYGTVLYNLWEIIGLHAKEKRAKARPLQDNNFYVP